MSSIINDRVDYFIRWWDAVEPKVLISGHVRVVVRNDGHGVYVANTLRRLGYHVNMKCDSWYPYAWIEVRKAAG
jgi:hypothetical protein